MAGTSPQNLLPFAIVAVILLFSLIRRIRRAVVYQPLNVKALIRRALFISILAALILIQAPWNSSMLLLALLGLLLGLLLAKVSARITSIQWQNGRYFYRPNRYIGTLLIVIFLGRLVVRIAALQTLFHPQSGTLNTMSLSNLTQDPWTLATFLLLSGYYIGYSFWVRNRLLTLPINPDSD